MCSSQSTLLYALICRRQSWLPTNSTCARFIRSPRRNGAESIGWSFVIGRSPAQWTRHNNVEALLITATSLLFSLVSNKVVHFVANTVVSFSMDETRNSEWQSGHRMATWIINRHEEINRFEKLQGFCFNVHYATMHATQIEINRMFWLSLSLGREHRLCRHDSNGCDNCLPRIYSENLLFLLKIDDIIKLYPRAQRTLPTKTVTKAVLIARQRDWRKEIWIILTLLICIFRNFPFFVCVRPLRCAYLCQTPHDNPGDGPLLLANAISCSRKCLLEFI